jgi:hypothetical protein
VRRELAVVVDAYELRTGSLCLQASRSIIQYNIDIQRQRYTTDHLFTSIISNQARVSLLYSQKLQSRVVVEKRRPRILVREQA